MACENQVGVKNILLTFFNCDTDERIGPISHILASEDIPQVKTCGVVNERLTDGYIQISRSDARIELNVVRDIRIPLFMYQGCAAIDIQMEMLNGLVYTGIAGNVIGDETSDTHAVTMDLSYKEIDELLPTGALVSG